jgi:hypothetical protein
MKSIEYNPFKLDNIIYISIYNSKFVNNYLYLLFHDDDDDEDDSTGFVSHI